MKLLKRLDWKNVLVILLTAVIVGAFLGYFVVGSKVTEQNITKQKIPLKKSKAKVKVSSKPKLSLPKLPTNKWKRGKFIWDYVIKNSEEKYINPWVNPWVNIPKKYCFKESERSTWVKTMYRDQHYINFPKYYNRNTDKKIFVRKYAEFFIREKNRSTKTSS